ncbi:hypothetical protein GCM10008942_05170 [Rhizomicrobium electricum]|uniref:Uncharacterized protein n=1 Tax=Rhizomicrobium electricum TaxID=480070 RepID=A0ABP3P8C9_9PROT
MTGTNRQQIAAFDQIDGNDVAPDHVANDGAHVLDPAATMAAFKIDALAARILTRIRHYRSPDAVDPQPRRTPAARPYQEAGD